MGDAPKTAVEEREYREQLREMNEALLVSSVRQHELTEQAQRAEAALRESEEKYRTLFNSIDEGFSLLELIFDDKGKVVDYWLREANPMYEQLTGLHDFIGKRGKEVLPNLEPEWLEKFETVYHTGEPVRFEYPIEQLGRFYTAHLSRVGGEGSRLIAAVFDDVTERKLGELRLLQQSATDAYRISLNDALRPLSDAATIQGTTAKLLREYFGVGWVYYVEFDDTKTIITVVSDSTRDGLPSMVGRHDFSDMPEFLALWQAGRIVRVDDFQASSLLSPRAKKKYLASGVSSFLGAPVLKNGVLIAALILADTEAQPWSDIAIDLTAESAERTWATVERARAEEALRESEEAYRTLFNSIDEGFCTIQVLFDEDEQPVDYRFLAVSPSFEKQTGIENAVGRRMREIAPQLEEFWFETYGRIALRGEAMRFEHRAAELDRFYDVYAFRIGEAAERRVAVLFNDITERKRAEEALRESQKFVQGIIASAPMALYIFDLAEQKNVYLSPQVSEIFGYTAEEMQASGSNLLAELFHPEDLPHVAKHFDRIRQSGENEIFEIEYRIKHAGGRWLWVKSRDVIYRRDGEGVPTQILGTAEDITHRKQAEEALRESETRFRATFEQANVGIVQLSFDGKFQMVNPGFCKIVGHSEGECRNLTVRDITHPDDYELEEAETRRLLAGEIAGYTLDKRFIHKGGSVVWGRMTAALVRTESGEPFYLLAIVEDITERKRAEEALRRSHDELEERVHERTVELFDVNDTLLAEIHERMAAEDRARGLVRQIVTAQEDERRRVSRDLHDHLGQQLTALQLKLEAHRAQLSGDAPLRAQVEEIQTVTRRLDADVDFLAWELRPVSLDDLGLPATLANFVEEWSKHFGTPAEFHTSGFITDGDRPPPEVESNLYRIAQEALNNVHKHAAAGRVDVILDRRADHVALIVEDDGQGFDPNHTAGPKDRGIGLTSMQERASFVGGRLEIESAPGGGTTVFVRVPLAVVNGQ